MFSVGLTISFKPKITQLLFWITLLVRKLMMVVTEKPHYFIIVLDISVYKSKLEIHNIIPSQSGFLPNRFYCVHATLCFQGADETLPIFCIILSICVQAMNEISPYSCCLCIWLHIQQRLLWFCMLIKKAWLLNISFAFPPRPNSLFLLE